MLVVKHHVTYLHFKVLPCPFFQSVRRRGFVCSDFLVLFMCYILEKTVVDCSKTLEIELLHFSVKLTSVTGGYLTEPSVPYSYVRNPCVF